jgi:hypothetical protein
MPSVTVLKTRLVYYVVSYYDNVAGIKAKNKTYFS